MRVPEAIVESTTLNCETLRNQEDSQISLDLTQLVGKPLEISENIHVILLILFCFLLIYIFIYLFFFQF